MSKLSDSELSSLSSAPPTDDESSPMAVDEPVGITKYFKKESETPPPKREPSPPHEYVLADNPDIAFIVMFRARFHEVFPRSTPHYGPQDIERGVEESPPGDYVERLLCALLGLVLNRKKEVEYDRPVSKQPRSRATKELSDLDTRESNRAHGLIRRFALPRRNHYQRPLEEAIHSHASQWPKAWQGKNPLSGGHNFATMTPEERLLLLKSLIIWSLSSSEAVQAKVKESYKQSRQEDDLNQPLSVQPWGRDSLKRRYWLIEGLDDTHFRLYRESNPALKNVTWWSIAGSIPELQAVADKLGEEKGTHAKKLSERIRNSIPRFESSEDKRKRRDYRLARKAAFARPEPGFSLYEGRTRGKKLKYTYSDDEDMFSDDGPTTRRSTRNTSGTVTPAEAAGPRFTASGRAIRSRAGGSYGEALLAGQRGDDTAEEDTGRPQRTRTTRSNGYFYEMDDGSEAGQSSENEWQGGDDEEDNEFEGDDEEEDASGDESVVNGQPPSLVVQLRYGKGNVPASSNGTGEEHPPAEQQSQDPEVNGPPDTTQEAPAGSDTKMQVEVPPAADEHKGPNGVAHGPAKDSRINAEPEAPAAQPVAVHGTNETG